MRLSLFADHRILVDAWNKKNPIKEQEIELLEKSILDIKEKIKKAKARK